jgi:hypothetical protein
LPTLSEPSALEYGKPEGKRKVQLRLNMPRPLPHILTSSATPTIRKTIPHPSSPPDSFFATAYIRVVEKKKPPVMGVDADVVQYLVE